MTRLLAIDPGPLESAWLIYDTDTRRPLDWHKDRSELLLDLLEADAFQADACAIEMIASYGMAVGAEVFSTCLWIGKFSHAYEFMQGGSATLVFRRECKLHLCADSRAKDSNVRQALIDRYGPGKAQAVGLKASPGPLYGMKADCWAALAVAVTAAETRLTMGEAA